MSRALNALQMKRLMATPLPRSYMTYIGNLILRLLLTIQGMGAFALITFSVLISKRRVSRAVIAPLIQRESVRAGVRLLPMFSFFAVALGLAVIGQTVAFLTTVNATSYLGTAMVLVVVRELGPLMTAILVLLRCGTANVIELGTARAQGEVETLEALSIDPIHYFVVPRVIGMGLGVYSLTVFFIIATLFSGYIWAFLQDVPLYPGEYFQQLARALSVWDFVIIALKSSLFGAIIAVVTCYHGLAQPLRLEHVSQATIAALVQSLLACVLVDVLFILVYLVL